MQTQLTVSTSSYHTCTSTEISKNETSTGTTNVASNTKHVGFVDISTDLKVVTAAVRANCNVSKTFKQIKYLRFVLNFNALVITKGLQAGKKYAFKK